MNILCHCHDRDSSTKDLAEVLVKLIRVIANMAIHSDVGPLVVQWEGADSLIDLLSSLFSFDLILKIFFLNIKSNFYKVENAVILRCFLGVIFFLVKCTSKRNLTLICTQLWLIVWIKSLFNYFCSTNARAIWRVDS